jgi:hypothetical protein
VCLRVNLLVCLEAVLEAVRAEDTTALLAALAARPLALGPNLVLRDNAELYLTNLLDYAAGLAEGGVLKRDLILAAVLSANQLAGEKDSTEAAIREVNEALR